ncbi:MAG: helix-turn-helix domain-containing protein [Lachnospiraceae bacterium]|nr:helix-turn-helix domain-containing protein [Lachnospiraceae bacterium]
MGMNLFLNDYFEVLKILDENEATILDEKVIPLTQLQIANIMTCSKMKVNTMFQNLQKEGFIEQKTRGKYVLTDNARSIIKTIDNIDKKIMGR